MANQMRADSEPGEAEIPALEQFLGYNLKRAYMVVYEDFRAALGGDGFAPRVFSALAIVVQFPNITQSNVAQHLGIERSGLVAIIDELEERGLVKRMSVPGDRRAQALVATSSGVSTFAEAQQAVQQHEARLLSDFSETEIATLIGLLQRIRNTEEAG